MRVSNGCGSTDPAGTGRTVDGLARELRRHVSLRLTPALAPVRVDVLDALPRLAGGKLDRMALAAAADEVGPVDTLGVWRARTGRGGVGVHRTPDPGRAS